MSQIDGLHSATIRFGVFELDTGTGELRKRGVKLRLTDQAYRILKALLEQPGEIVTRARLKERVWSDGTFVDFESAINKSVSQLRTVLGDSGQNPRFIETMAKRGYRFIAPIQPSGQSDISPSIIVFPFENLTGDSAQTYFADGLTDMLTTALGQSKGFRVVSRTSAKASMTASMSLSAIGREFRVDSAIEGSVICLEPKLCVTVRLVDIHSGLLIWQSEYDSEIGSLLSLCDQMVHAITAELNPSKGPQALSKQRPLPSSPEAHLAYLRGRYLWNRRTERDLYGSIKEFERALGFDSGFALAHTGLADAYVLLGIWGVQPPHMAFRMARRSAERALELNATLAEAHTCLAEVLKDYDWDWPGAEREYRLAINLNPNYSTAHHRYAQLLTSLRRHKEAAEEIEMARRVDPLSPAINAYVPYIYLASRDCARALDEGQRAVELEPYSPLAHWHFGRACLFYGSLSEALSELENASKLSGHLPMWRAELSFARALAGDASGARAILNELTTLARTSYVSPYDLALCYAGLEDRSAALDHLEHAYRERVMRIIAIGDPEFDGIRQEHRFCSLVERLRLPNTQLNSHRDSLE